MKKFTVQNITTWGLKKDEKYGGYKLPVSFKDDQSIVDKIQKLVEKQETKSPFYGEYKTIFFKLYELTKKQRQDLLDQDRRKIDLSFVVEATPTRSESKNLNYLNLRVIGLKRSETDESQAPSDEI